VSTAVPPRPRTLEASVDVETPEQVMFSYTLAGVGSRALAAFVDYLLCLLAFMGVVFLLVVLGLSGLGRLVGSASSAWAIAVLVIAQFMIVWGYYVLFEGLNDGQTPGKQWLRLRVVQDGGYSVTFGASAVRNLMRIVDLQPLFMYGVGLVSIVISKSGKRLGDILAGTIVVRERVTRVRVVEGHANAPPNAAKPERAPLHTLLTDEEFAVLSRFTDRRGTLDADRRNKLTAQLAARFRTRAPDLSGPDAAFLSALHDHETRARTRGVAARSDTGAAREQHALVAAGSARWSAFATTLANVQRRGLGALPEREVSAFVAEYREMTTDLARLQTATRGRDVDSVFALSRLVAAAHNIVYRRRPLTARAALDYLVVNVPREIRNSARPILLAALLLFGPAAISWTAVVLHPAAAAAFIPPGMIERASQGVERSKNDEGYIPDPQLLRPVMASRIVANNVQVTFAAFAFGITAGIGTLWLLVFNGVSLGGVMGLYQSKGILPLIVAFVAPHSVLELGAICIAGGAGLLIGAGILLPGARTRKEALVANGRRAIHLIAGSTMFLIIAGTIEGFISPIPWWPIAWKAGVTVVSAVFFFGFIMLGRGSENATAPRVP
jgi:uncharacterized membrane protein SpoIIM required for sporulation/uncharacterized RDD family membrane protein YckC